MKSQGLPALQTLYRFFIDKTTDWKPKVLVGLATLYAIWPMDVIPDIPVIGWLDDIGFGAFALWYLTRKINEYEQTHRDN